MIKYCCCICFPVNVIKFYIKLVAVYKVIRLFFVLKIFNVHARVELQYIPNTALKNIYIIL